MTYFEPSLRRKLTPKKRFNWVKVSLFFAALATVVHFVWEPQLVIAQQEDYSIVDATITAYTSSTDETDENPNENAAGGVPQKGSLACPSKYAFGTEVVIEGETYTCDDRMNKRFRNTERFDIWMTTKKEAKTWGKKELTVLVYKR